MAKERTFIMLKPDALERALVGEIVSRFERAGLRQTRSQWRVLSEGLVKEHYAHLENEPYFDELKEYMTRGPVLASIWEGENAIAAARATLGATDPKRAEPGTIRAEYARDEMENLVHASDSPEAAEREIRAFFKE